MKLYPLPLFALLFTVIGCDSSPASTDGPIPVVATTSMIADAVRIVGGDRVRVECLMGPGIDPHRYTASAGDIGKLGSARIVFFHGLHLEGKMDDVLGKVGGKRKTVAVTEGIEHAKLRKAEAGGDGPHDPHVWMDPLLWMSCVNLIAAELSIFDPPHATEYLQHAAAYIRQLQSLHDETVKTFAAIPVEKRLLVTSHDAFAYFGCAYGIQVRGLQGVSTAAETGTKDVQELAEFLGTNRVPAVFCETSVPSKGLEAVLDAVKSKYKHEVKLIGGADALYSDALGETGTRVESYLGMMRHNVTVIATALAR